MDMRTGEIHEGISEERAKELGLKAITQDEAKKMAAVKPEIRPMELELKRFMGPRSHTPLMLRSAMELAFRAGYSAAEKNLKD